MLTIANANALSSNTNTVTAAAGSSVAPAARGGAAAPRALRCAAALPPRHGRPAQRQHHGPLTMSLRAAAPRVRTAASEENREAATAQHQEDQQQDLQQQQHAAESSSNGNGASAAATTMTSDSTTTTAAEAKKDGEAKWDPDTWRPDVAAIAPPEFKALEGGDLFWARAKMALALPWRRFKKGSVLAFKLDGEVSDALKGRFAPGFSVPQIVAALEKAALDPRVAGVAVEIGPLAVGWGKLQELRRAVELFRRSGKFSVAWMKNAAEKEYYLASAFGEVYAPPTGNVRLNGFAVAGTFLRGALDKAGVEPQVKRIGAYKSAGDQLLRRDMSAEQREQLDALLEDIYEEFVATVAAARGKTREVRGARGGLQGVDLHLCYRPHPTQPYAARPAKHTANPHTQTYTHRNTHALAQDVEALFDEGVFDAARLVEAGWLDGLRYEDEIIDDLKGRTGGKPDAVAKVGLRKYASVRPSTFGIGGGKKRIAVLRCGGAILGASSSAGSNTITPDALIPRLRALAKDKGVAAVVLRVDSPGGDALASDLMWREVRQLCAKKPVIACMADVAASGGIYLALGAAAIVAQPLTVTGSIGVVTGKFSLAQLYERIG